MAPPYVLVALVEAEPHRPRPAEGSSARVFLDSLYDAAIPAIRGSGLDGTRTLGV